MWQQSMISCVLSCSAFLKGDNPGTGPSKDELKLRRAQRSAAKTGISKPLHETILKMPGGEEWCTRTPHLEGEEVFVSLKRKPDTAFGDERESHRPDKISVSSLSIEPTNRAYAKSNLLTYAKISSSLPYFNNASALRVVL
jgi:hypothetical protein